MLGLQEHNIRQNLQKMVMHIKFYISVLLTITTFLLSLLLSLKTTLFFADFFSLSNDSCYWYVMTNTSIRSIIINGKYHVIAQNFSWILYYLLVFTKL